MKRVSMVVFLLSIFSIVLFPVQKISKRFLINISFFGSGFLTTELRFYTNNRYKFVQGMSGSTETVEGLYVIRNNKIYLRPSMVGRQEKNYLPGKSICILRVSSDYFLNSYFLEIRPADKQKKFVLRRTMEGHVPKFTPGEKKVYKNVPVIVIGYRNAYTTSNVKIRLLSKPLLFQYRDSLKNDGDCSLKIITSLKVIARTVKKKRIGSWYDYWYLVDVGRNNRGWMYGAFIEFDN